MVPKLWRVFMQYLLKRPLKSTFDQTKMKISIDHCWPEFRNEKQNAYLHNFIYILYSHITLRFKWKKISDKEVYLRSDPFIFLLCKGKQCLVDLCMTLSLPYEWMGINLWEKDIVLSTEPSVLKTGKSNCSVSFNYFHIIIGYKFFIPISSVFKTCIENSQKYYVH